MYDSDKCHREKNEGRTEESTGKGRVAILGKIIWKSFIDEIILIKDLGGKGEALDSSYKKILAQLLTQSTVSI